ncbi:enolase-phosphatase e1 [Diplodia corticola]|uniref:Enolase-phosphatase e1 n=1 Tax=Diplodia corticola TaxID=236234 RepID=A0A1J9RVF5_9PEZI|nr:enolase-phosphatase e1 [Diplodia corticola]OJD31828.1 enolase-phosphatase e1 [Diplodia corticola]
MRALVGIVPRLEETPRYWFPYAIDVLPETATAKWDDAEFKSYVEAFPELAQKSAKTFSEYAINLMKQDSKVPYLKKLQGYLWKNGWNTGAFVAPLYPDVLPELRQWRANGKQIAIFSSGSVAAQKLLFGHVGTADDCGAQVSANEDVAESSDKKRKSDETGAEESVEEPESKKPKATEPLVDPPARLPGVQQRKHEVHRPYLGEDINDMIVDYFDTQNAGPKQEAASYVKIAGALAKPCNEILFLSDNVKEVKAALEAGMKSFVIDRPGNEPLSDDDREAFTVHTSFKDIPLLEKA